LRFSVFLRSIAGMANTKSAKKAERVSKRRYVFNARRKKTMKDEVKTVGKLIAAKNAAGAEKALPSLYKAIDKAAKNGTIKKNTASRMKSRIVKRMRAVAA
jgi:small subunit ribosomal protein S20